MYASHRTLENFTQEIRVGMATTLPEGSHDSEDATAPQELQVALKPLRATY